MADKITLTILKYRGQTPVFAVCVRCELKFFTPFEIMTDREAAIRYLWMKYIDHRCAATFPQDEDKRAPHRGIAIVSPAFRKLSA